MHKIKNKSYTKLTPQTKARLLVEKIKFNNPVSVAMQLTTIDKDLYLQLKPSEVVNVLLGKPKKLVNFNIYFGCTKSQ